MPNYKITKEIEQEVKEIVEKYYKRDLSSNKDANKPDTIRYLMRTYYGQTANSCQRISFNNQGCSVVFDKNNESVVLSYSRLVEITKDQLTLF